jgi:RNA 2',3'-cyclic 3'-phosphodiesterase
VRLFVAVELDPAVRASAAETGDALSARLPRGIDVRWIPEENLHITLQFLGEVDDAAVPQVVSALDIPFKQQPFTIDIDGLGAFPPSGPPRVFWLGVRGGSEELTSLHDEVASAMEPLGFPREQRRYTGHLTIARVKEPGSRTVQTAVRRLLAELPAHAGQSQVRGVTLVRSRLSPKGASYESVLRVPLKR